MRILVVDNASSDDSVASIRREFPSVEVIVNALNLRFAGGNNVGIRHALQKGTEYVLLLNNDTTVDPEFLTELVKRAEGDPAIGMVGAKIYYYSDPGRIWFAGGRIEWWKGWISHIGLRESDHGQHDTSADVDYITGCCLLVKRSVIDKTGMLDERFFMYGEDVDWCLRAQRAGFRLLYEPRAKVWHKLSVSSGGHFSWYKNRNKLKSTVRLALRYAHPVQWLTIPFLLPFRLLRQVLGIRQPTTAKQKDNQKSANPI
jgi:hypothetical protein